MKEAARITPGEVAASSGFRAGLPALAQRLGRSEEDVRREAEAYLHELRTKRNLIVLDWLMRFFRWAYRRAYDKIDIAPEQLAMLGETMARHPTLVLPSHKANLDAPIVDTVLHHHGIPPPTLFAGINMSFWPMGPVLRNAGRIFLRRGIGDQPVYRFALREYIACMVERGCDFEWFPEGTRSRTGKLLPPKLGLMTYVVEAYRRGRVDDVMLAPVALVYDQVYETADFIREARGETKPAENFRWMMEYVRELRRPYGTAYLRFAEPLSMRAALGPPDPQTDPKSPQALLAMHKLALAVSWRTNEVTPVTGISLVAFALLATGGRAVPRARLERYAQLAVGHLRARDRPIATSGELDRPGRLDAALDALLASGVIERDEAEGEAFFTIAEGQHIAAAFYRNAMLHFVLERAIGELAVLDAAREPAERREATFFAAAVRLRAALKFEFFFRERPEFECALGEEMDRVRPEWRGMLVAADGPEAAFRAIFAGMGTAHSALRPFVEANWVIAELLTEVSADRSVDRPALLDKALARGRRHLLEHRLRNPEAVSKPLFSTAFDLAAHLRLTEPMPGVAQRRTTFERQLGEALETLATIEDITRGTI